MRIRAQSVFLVLFFLILSGFLFLASGNLAAQRKEEVPNIGGTYRRPLEFNPRTLDPALSLDMYSATVTQQLFDGLVQFDKNLGILPAIAKSWKISTDGLTYTFYLREGVKFHHGREVTAEDFVYSFTRIIDPKTNSPAESLLNRVVGFKEFQEGNVNHVKGLHAIDKYTLEIRLSERYSPFLSVLGMNKFKVLPSKEVEKSPLDFGKHPIGTGPFKFVSLKEGEEIILEANSDYFEGKPYLDRMVFRIFHGAPRKEILRIFEEGGLEESFIPPDELENVARGKRYLFLQKPILSLRFYGFNVMSGPSDNKKLRKAVNFGINKRAIISEIHKNQFNLAKGILPPGMPGYDPKKDFYPYDEKRAEKQLNEAGYRREQPLQIWSASRSEAAQKELNEVQSQLNRVGIPTTLHYETDWPTYESMLKANKAPMFIYAWYADFPDPDNFLGILFHSKSRYNFTAYHNPEVDRLLDQARAERDYLKRMEMYRKVEEIVLDDAPIVPMVNHLFQMVYQPYVRGVEVSALGGPYIPMKKVWLKKE